VAEEIAKADRILSHLETANLFASPYVVSAVYYHDGFLDGYPEQRADANPARRIVAHAAKLLTPELKSRYIQLLRELEAAPPAAAGERLVPPVSGAESGYGRRRTHRYAVDLFVPHGTPVRSATRGVVALAEGNWTRGDPFSTSSQGGGNSVIVFDRETNRFCRYCHLRSVTVTPGAAVAAGQVIGTVGNTGSAASRRGHGAHLHFEINGYDGRQTRPLASAELRALLRARP
jgi:murein DD-endopeptidase MepM/ murein hydrolase activator NlpD